VDPNGTRAIDENGTGLYDTVEVKGGAEGEFVKEAAPADATAVRISTKENTEGYISKSLESAVMGSFSKEQTALSIGLEIVIGFTPIGIATDVRDFTASISEGDAVGTVFAGIGFIPLIGDVAKSVHKASKVAKVVVDESNVNGIKRGHGGRGGGPEHAKVQQDITNTAGGVQEYSLDNIGRIADNFDSKGRIHQIGDMRTRGGVHPSARERGAIEDIRKEVGNSTDIIYHDKLGKHPTLINPDLQKNWKPAPIKHRKNP
jgi:hypothetical protein